MEQVAERRVNTTIRIRNVQFDGNSALVVVDTSVLLSNLVFDNVASPLLPGCGGAVTMLSESPQLTAIEVDGVRFDSNRGKCMLCPPPRLLRISPRDDALQ